MWKYQFLAQWNYCVSSLKASSALENQISNLAMFKVAGIKAEVVLVGCWVFCWEELLPLLDTEIHMFWLQEKQHCYTSLWLNT